MYTQFRFNKKPVQSLRQKVYFDIREAIIKGDLQPGAHLNESLISQQMGISRGPIREAIRSLEQEGLVISHPYRATIVADVSEEEVKNVIVPIRRTIETYAAKEVTKTLNGEDIEHLYNEVEKMKEASNTDNLENISELDLAFHNYIIEKSGIPSCISIWNSISGKIHIRLLVQGIKHESFQTVVDEHLEYIELLKKGNNEKLEKYLERHIT